ncbi:hypothetical protein Rleg5DRAFT_5986 [Rhizobium leguminosarum bv. viciae WSM1455]|nr:hypothetical protein Rleg5DRAFT_5986 [Rhizobium leguminosarum bv. viciae WSM1455]
MGHLRVMRTTDASSKQFQEKCEAVLRPELRKNKCVAGDYPQEFRQVAGFGVGSGIAPVTTVSEEASSSTGGR